jgi:DNA-binding MarR family transcriptional regulator
VNRILSRLFLVRFLLVQQTGPTDVVDEIVADVHRLHPGLEAAGLPITGRVLRLAHFLTSRREEVLAPFGLSVADFDVLASLRRRAGPGAVNIRDLQRWVMLSSGGMTKRLDRLQRAGLLERLPDPADRRGVLVRLSDAGRYVIDRALPAVTAAETALVADAIASADLRAQVEAGLRHLLVDQERR